MKPEWQGTMDTDPLTILLRREEEDGEADAHEGVMLCGQCQANLRALIEDSDPFVDTDDQEVALRCRVDKDTGKVRITTVITERKTS